MAAPKKKTVEDLRKEMEEYRELVASYRAEVEQLRASRSDSADATDEVFDDVHMIADPYDNHNAFKVHGEIPPDARYPDGAVVQWKNPAYRARRTWRGWEPFEWGDDYTGKDGELLTNYIPDPPKYLMGADKIDNYVRRGDVVLARLDKKLYKARQLNRVEKSRQRTGEASSARGTRLGRGVQMFGEGITKSDTPSEYRTPPAPGAVRFEHSGPTQPASSEE